MGVLATGDERSIVRIGDAVHRPTGWWTPAVHELLTYLESVGFRYAPRVLGFDERGREVLTFMEGESGRDGWSKIHGDTGLQGYAALLRDYHDAVADYRPSAHSVWADAEGGLVPGEILCHGDFGPWNLAWDGDTPVGILDWDLVCPAPPTYDVLYGLEYAAPFRDDEQTLTWHHFAAVPNRRRRVDVFLEAYGTSREAVGDIVAGVAANQRLVGDHERRLAARGLQPQVSWVADGDLDLIESRARWTESHRSLFE